jgi:hypothetical protein
MTRLTPDQIHAFDTELAQIQNVRYCRIVVDDRGEIRNVDIVSDTRRAPQKIVRDAEVILRKGGVDIDHRKIGVVQLVSQNEPGPRGLDAMAHTQPHSPEDERGDEATRPAVLKMVPERERVQLSAVHCTMGSGSFMAEVELVFEGIEGVPGRAVGPAKDQEAAVEIVARATVEAVRNLLQPGYEALVREVRLLELSGTSLILVLLDFGRGRELSRLCGTCLQRGSLYETAVYATLDALNRSLGQAEFMELVYPASQATGTH